MKFNTYNSISKEKVQTVFHPTTMSKFSLQHLQFHSLFFLLSAASGPASWLKPLCWSSTKAELSFGTEGNGPCAPSVLVQVLLLLLLPAFPFT